MTKKMTLLTLLLWTGVSMFAQGPAIARDAKLEAKVEKTLAKMTLDEKIGQMLELNLDVMGKMTVENEKRVWKLNETMLDTCISKWKVGSILNAPGTRASSVEQWQEWIQLIQKKSMKYLGIPDIYGLDHNHGVTYTQGGHSSLSPSTWVLRSIQNWLASVQRLLPTKAVLPTAHGCITPLST